MATITRLQFGDNGSGLYSKEYLVTDFKCHMCRHHNEVRPDRNTRCERIELSIVVPGMDDLTLFEWYVNRSSMNGRILIGLSAVAQEQASQWKQVLFEDAMCYEVSEEYHIDSNQRRTLRVCFVADEVKIDQVEFKNS